MTKRPAVFLDRDGTLIEEVNFLSEVEHLRVFDYTKHALQRLKDAGFLLIVVTNQSGIGRGLYTEADMHAIHDALQERINSLIDGFYFCPHMPVAGCDCRKPGTGMFLQAETDHAIEIAASWMIGDKKIDMEAGKNAGVQTILVRTGYGAAHSESIGGVADVITDDLGEAAEIILARSAEIVL
ncbi:MAG: HAD family hydrolase [Acidobacteriota bacterium]|nr:MAG: HAD family hydrolase [Acidobacteriota bacterium]